MEQNVNSNNAGFTLVEFLVALVILMVGMLGLLQMVNMSMFFNLTTQFRNEAVMVADDLMMQERNKAFANITASTVKSGFVKRDLRNAFKNYSTSKSISTLTFDSDGISPKSKEIVLTLTWKHKNQPYRHILSTVVTKN
jgi:type IV pilus assembly protein PilV